MTSIRDRAVYVLTEIPERLIVAHKHWKWADIMCRDTDWTARDILGHLHELATEIAWIQVLVDRAVKAINEEVT
jgi:hypothetical protein